MFGLRDYIHDKRVSDVNLRLGDVGVGTNLPDNGLFSRLLPDIDCSDNEHDDIQFPIPWKKDILDGDRKIVILTFLCLSSSIH